MRDDGAYTRLGTGRWSVLPSDELAGVKTVDVAADAAALSAATRAAVLMALRAEHPTAR